MHLHPSSSGIHPTAVIGEPPESREFNADPIIVCYPPDIHSTARVNAFVTVDAGLTRPTRVGPRSFLMAKSHVGHDCQVGADCELSTGAILGGHSVLEDGVRVGLNATVLPRKRIGRGARIGAGAVVTKDVPPGEVWAGNPARPMEKQPESVLAAAGDYEEWAAWWDESRA